MISFFLIHVYVTIVNHSVVITCSQYPEYILRFIVRIFWRYVIFLIGITCVFFLKSLNLITECKQIMLTKCSNFVINFTPLPQKFKHYNTCSDLNLNNKHIYMHVFYIYKRKLYCYICMNQSFYCL